MIQRNTVQRRQVLEAVRRLHDHPTAEEVYTYFSEQGAGLGRATVYRNLNVLCGQGLLRHIELPDAPDRFDDTLTEHYHLSCRVCGCFQDVTLPGAARLDRAVARQTGFADVTHDIVFSGVCSACRQAAAPQ